MTNIDEGATPEELLRAAIERLESPSPSEHETDLGRSLSQVREALSAVYALALDTDEDTLGWSQAEVLDRVSAVSEQLAENDRLYQLACSTRREAIGERNAARDVLTMICDRILADDEGYIRIVGEEGDVYAWAWDDTHLNVRGEMVLEAWGRLSDQYAAEFSASAGKEKALASIKQEKAGLSRQIDELQRHLQAANASAKTIGAANREVRDENIRLREELARVETQRDSLQCAASELAVQVERARGAEGDDTVRMSRLDVDNLGRLRVALAGLRRVLRVEPESDEEAVKQAARQIERLDERLDQALTRIGELDGELRMARMDRDRYEQLSRSAPEREPERKMKERDADPFAGMSDMLQNVPMKEILELIRRFKGL